MAREFKENPKKLHKFVRSKMRVREKIGSLENSVGEMCCDNKVKAEMLNDQFKSVFVEEDLGNIPEVDRTWANISDLSISEEIVRVIQLCIGS